MVVIKRPFYSRHGRQVLSVVSIENDHLITTGNNLVFFFLSAFVGSWFVIFLLAAFYEGLKTFRDVLAQRDLCNACSPSRDRQTTM